jgi:pyruvate/2-oxoglutarate dehydrogenase complex dihydrolipoamide dehydrogenase (E3) component
VLERVNRVVDTIRGGDGDQNVRNMGTDLYKGHARFLSPHEIEITGLDGSASGRGTATIRGDKVIVATGGHSRSPAIDRLAEVGYITNVEAVALPELPRSLAIVGGGVIAVEFAQIFARFGVEVAILGSAPHLLPREEPDLTDELRRVLEREGVQVETGVRVSWAWLEGGLKFLSGVRGDETVIAKAEQILFAAGRQPTVDGLDLEAAGIAYDARQGIRVDEELRTTAPGVWAIGDVIDHYPYTHVADYQARIAEHNALSGRPTRRVDYRAVPWATFSDPELARVGLTEAEAVAAGHDVRCAVIKMRDLARAITSGETEGMVKLVGDRRSGKLLGGHVLAAHGGELLGEIALAIRLGIPVMELAETIHAYPTLSESVFWAAFELAKPDDPALEATRGIQSPAGDVPADV